MELDELRQEVRETITRLAVGAESLEDEFINTAIRSLIPKVTDELNTMTRESLEKMLIDLKSIEDGI